MCFIQEEHCRCCKKDVFKIHKKIFCGNEKCSIFQIEPIFKNVCFYCSNFCKIVNGFKECSTIQLPKISYYVDKLSFRKTKFQKIVKLKFWFLNLFDEFVKVETFKDYSSASARRLLRKKNILDKLWSEN